MKWNQFNIEIAMVKISRQTTPANKTLRFKIHLKISNYQSKSLEYMIILLHGNISREEASEIPVKDFIYATYMSKKYFISVMHIVT